MLLLWSCQPESVSPPYEASEAEPSTTIDPRLQDDWQILISVKDGTMVFDDWQALAQVRYGLFLLPHAERGALEAQHGFRSQRWMFQEIIRQEEAVTEAFYAPYQDLSLAEIKALNLQEPRSELYQEALNKHLLTVLEDSDTAHVYHLSVVDPVLAEVLDDQGFFMVSDTLWQYTASQIKYCAGCGLEDKALLARAQRSDEAAGISVTDARPLARLSFSENWDGVCSSCWVTDGKERVRYRRFGYSERDNSWCGNMFVKYYLHVEAQKKNIWGTWKYRSGFKVNFEFTGSWSGVAKYHPVGDPFPTNIHLSQFSVALGSINTPINHIYYGNNYELPLHNHTSGYWTLPSGLGTNCWSDVMDMTSINIDGKVPAADPSHFGDLSDGCQLIHTRLIAHTQ